MSEALNWNPGNGVLKVPTNSGEVIGTASNSVIYLHPFEQRGADHIFVQTGENDEQALGVFVFRIASDAVMDNFDRVSAEMQQARFQVILADTVAECDQVQFDATMERAIASIGMTDLDKPWEVA